MRDHYVGDDILGKTRILSRQCSTCIMRPVGERIGLSNERITAFLRTAIADQTYVVCHSTLPSVAPVGVLPAVCRGFADAYDTRQLRLIRSLWGFVEVPPPGVNDRG